MRIILRLEFVNGTSKEIAASAADLVAFEREFNLSVSSLQADTKISHLLWLAWHSEKRRGESKLDFDSWVETVEAIGDSESDPK